MSPDLGASQPGRIMKSNVSTMIPANVQFEGFTTHRLHAISIFACSPIPIRVNWINYCDFCELRKIAELAKAGLQQLSLPGRLEPTQHVLALSTRTACNACGPVCYLVVI